MPVRDTYQPVAFTKQKASTQGLYQIGRRAHREHRCEWRNPYPGKSPALIMGTINILTKETRNLYVGRG